MIPCVSLFSAADVPDRSARLRAIGNAVDPTVAYALGIAPRRALSEGSA